MALFKKGKLFQERFCAICGKKAGALGRVELRDGNCLCSNCFGDVLVGVPKYISENLYEYYDVELLLALKEYVKYSEEVLEPKFVETTSIGKLHLDEKNGLFYIEEGFFSIPLYIELKNVLNFELEFKGEDVKKGVFKNVAIGSVYLLMNVAWPRFLYVKAIADDVKAQAKSTDLFNTKFVYSNPPEVEEFTLRFLIAHAAATATEDNNESSYAAPAMDELQKAKALFMLDDDEEFTLADIKKQRNKLISMYHPDTSSDSEADTRHAQKINNAYEILKKSLE